MTRLFSCSAWEYMPSSGHKFSLEVNYLIGKGYDVYRILPGNMYRNIRAKPGQKTDKCAYYSCDPALSPGLSSHLCRAT